MGDRTHDPWYQSPSFYQLSYADKINCYVGIYKTIQNGFGSFYLFNFTCIQIFTILSTYRTISIWLTEEISVLEMAVTSFGSLISALSFVLNALALTLTLEDAFQNLRMLVDMAKQDLGIL